MYQVKCLKNEFWYICDSVTMTPPLLSLRYCEFIIHKKAYNTQRAELQSLKFFYEFWYEKFRETLDYTLYKSNFEDIEIVINNLESYWDYLVSGKTIKIKVLYIDKINSTFEKLTTHATHCLAVVRFIKFLISTYIDSRYTNLSKTEILRSQTLLNMKLRTHQECFQKHINSSVSRNNYPRSLTLYQCDDFLKIIKPSTIKTQNLLNPYSNQSTQVRNYIICLLMLRYGLRVGEILLLQKSSFKPYQTDHDKILMLIQNLNDEKDSRSQKPQIKTSDSIRSIDISKDHYNIIIGIYYNMLRPAEELCEHDFIFASSTKPYAPLSYRAVLKEFTKSAKAFNRHFPEHFDVRYSYALTSNITPHWLRHTWAHSTLASLYKKTEDKMIKTQVVNISGAMDDAVDQLRKLGGWSLKSKMPQYYASRFIQEHANINLLSIFSNSIDENYSVEDFSYL